MLIDTHAHLDNRQFAADLPNILVRAHAAGVSTIVMPATTMESARRLLAMASESEQLHAAVGIHPTNVDSVSGEAWLSELRELAQTPGVAAIGEIGLDYFHAPEAGFTEESWRAHQAEVFTRQLDLAAELGLNAIVHTRESHEATLAIVRGYTGRVRTVFHCFTGTAEQAQELLDLGHLVSFTGIATFKNSPIVQATAKALPLEGFMLETDAPYLSPAPHRGKRCEPAYVAYTAGCIAELRGISEEELAEATTATARAFFAGL